MEKVSVLLKAFVIGAGVLLVGGVVLLTVVIIARVIDGGDQTPAVATGPVELALPSGARIEQVVPAGERVLLLGVEPSGRQFLAVIDPDTGERLSLIRVRADD